MKVQIKEIPQGTFALTEDGDWLCTHEDAEIERACCRNPVDNNGNVTCGCYGQDGVICLAWDCTGIMDYEVEDLFNRLEGGYEDDCEI